MSTTTMAPQPAFGFTFPLANGQYNNDQSSVDNSNVNSSTDPNATLQDFGFDFSSFTNFDPSTFTFNNDGADADFSADAFKQYMVDSPSEPSLGDSISTPASTEIVSPKSSRSSLDPTSPFASYNGTCAPSNLAPLPEEPALPSTVDIEALSNHHLERFLHYKALADEAQRKAEVNALAAQVQAQAQLDAQAQAQAQAQSGPFQTLLAPLDLNAGADMNMNAMSQGTKGLHGSMLLSYTAPAPATNMGPRQASFSYDPNMAQASMAQAQADAHLQAHTAAAAQVQQQRMQTQYWVDSSRRSFDQASAPMSEPAWSRSSFSSAHTGSYPSTPQYVSAPVMPMPPMPQQMPIKAESTLPPLAPLVAPIPPLVAPLAPIGSMPVPLPLSNGVSSSLPMQSGPSSARSSSSTDSVSKTILNPHGGGRGYIPGKTPDDPKKRHKCDICGRGFARAFNLKSHMATHDPERSKPHMCPHFACKRGFSRLHDLERHRQGIHNDGPLVDAKTNGVTPSVARAQLRSTKSSSSASASTATSASSPGASVNALPFAIVAPPPQLQ